VIDLAALDDVRLEPYRWLGDPVGLERAGLFVAEGRLVVARLLELAGVSGPWSDAVQSVLLSPAAYDHMRDVIGAHPGVPVYVVPQQVMNDVVGFNIHRGCLALARRPAVGWLSDEALRSVERVVVLEGVNNPDNVGGIFRSGAALGADLIALGPSCADPLYRKSVRTSMGATLAVPYVKAEPWTEALDRLRHAGFVLAALTPASDALPLPDWIPGTRKVALIAGAEGAGLSPATLAAADVRLRIPMSARVDSLNVHTSLAIALYHVQMSRTS